jgi:hypothetical protein
MKTCMGLFVLAIQGPEIWNGNVSISEKYATLVEVTYL